MHYATFKIFMGAAYLIMSVIAFIGGFKKAKSSFKKLNDQLDEQEKRKAFNNPEFEKRKPRLDH